MQKYHAIFSQCKAQERAGEYTFIGLTPLEDWLKAIKATTDDVDHYFMGEVSHIALFLANMESEREPTKLNTWSIPFYNTSTSNAILRPVAEHIYTIFYEDPNDDQRIHVKLQLAFKRGLS